MTTNPDERSLQAFRQRAEERFAQQPPASVSAQDASGQLRELQINSIALALQNEALLESEKKFRMLTETAPEFIFWLDPHSRYQYVSPACLDITGYTAEEFIKDPELMSSLILPADRAAFAQHLDNRHLPDPAELEFRILHRNGSTRWIRHRCAPIFDASGTYVGRRGCQSDITQRKQAEFAAEAGNRAKSDFLSAMSHELRTPLNGVLGMAQLLQMEQLNAEQRDEVNTILDSANSLLASIDDILDFAAMESDQQTRVKTASQPRAVLRELDEYFSSAIAIKQLSFRSEIAPDVPEQTTLDGRLFPRVLKIIVRNAIAITPQGEVVVTMHMSKSEQDVRYLVITVRDAGLGMTQDELDQLFSPNSRHAHGGSGVGLALAKRLIGIMGGTITVISQVSAGSAFVVSLPVLD